MQRLEAVPILLLLANSPAAHAAGTPAAPPAAKPADSDAGGEHVIPVTFATTPAAPSAQAAQAAHPAPPPRFTNPAKDVGAFVLVIVAVFVVLYGGLRGARALWRKRGRRCPECGKTMAILPTADAFAHLDLAERTEQLVGDVRYDVWACASCGHVEKSGRVRSFQGSAETLAPVGSAAYLRQQQRDGLSIWAKEPEEPGATSPATPP